ncbi:LysR substrate binding domain protein [compost metagenome]
MKFSCTDIVAKEWVSPAIKSFNKLYPQVHPFVFVGQGSQALEYIRDGHLDFGFFFYVPELYGDFEIKDIKKVPFELVIGAKWEKDEAVISRFIGSREVDFLGAKRFPTLERLKKKYPKAKIELSSNSLELHKEWVLQGMGVSILPRFLIESELKSGKLKKVLPEGVEFSMKIVTKQGKTLSKRSQLFIDLFKESL